MSLTIRFSTEEKVLRSVGDFPNGVVGVAFGRGGARWICDSSWEPRRGQQETVVEMVLPHDEHTQMAGVTDLAVEEVIAGADSEKALVELANSALEVYEKAIRPAMRNGEPDVLRELFDLAVETVELSGERLKAEGWA